MHTNNEQGPQGQPKFDTEALLAIHDFFSFFPYEEAKAELWYCFTTAISSDGSNYDEGKERSRLLFLLEQLMALLAAIRPLHSNNHSTN